MTRSSGPGSSCLVGVFVVAVILAVYSAIPNAQFVQWDDDINIYGNPHHGGISWSRIIWMFTDTRYVLYYAPMSWLALSVIYEFCGLNPSGYHFASLLLHGANGLLAYYLIRGVMVRTGSFKGKVTEPTLSIICGIAALVWAIHPLRVEAVAWATGISYLLSGFFSLLSLLCYLHSISEERTFHRFWFVLSLGFFFCGILSYPAVMALPVAFVLLDLAVLRRFAGFAGGWRDPAARIVWFEKLPYFVMSAAVLAFTLYRRAHASGVWSTPPSLEQFGIAERAMQAFYVWAWYLWKHIVPVALAPVYTQLISFHAFEPPFLLSALVVGSISACLFCLRKQCSGLGTLWVGYLLLLVPLLGLTEHPHNTADRYSYLVSLLLSLAMAGLLLRLALVARLKLIVLLVAGAVLVSLASLSYRQTLVWNNSVSLFEQVVTTVGDHPYRANCEMRLGAAWFQAGDLKEAEAHLRKSLALEFDAYQTHAHLANVLASKGELDEGIREFDLTLVRKPNYIRAYVQKARLLYRQGRTPEAIRCYYDAIARDPVRPEALEGLAWIRATDQNPLYRNGPEAVALGSKAFELSKRPNPDLLLTLSAAYAEAGQIESALRTCAESASLAVRIKDLDALRKADLIREALRTTGKYRNHDAVVVTSPSPQQSAGEPWSR